MNRRTCLKKLSVTCLATAGLAACRPEPGEAVETQPAVLPDWAIGPFRKHGTPVLSPDPESRFFCPVSRQIVRWEEQNTYNPAAVVRDDKVYILYRGDDVVQHEKWDRTCRTGLAWSSDGVHFERHPVPVLYPDEDAFKQYEWVGGTEDIHVIESGDTFYANYTAWNGETDTIILATSDDLIHWTKRGPALGEETSNPRIRDRTGVVVSRLEDGKLVAARIGGKYWMYYGLKSALATSEDLVSWTPLMDNSGFPVLAMQPRPGYFDSGLSEAGAIALLTDDGIVLFYNAYNEMPESGGDPEVLAGWSSLGQALMDRDDPTKLLAQLDKPFLEASLDWEKDQFIPVALVSNAMVPFNGEWLLYYGGGDRFVGMARGPAVG